MDVDPVRVHDILRDELGDVHQFMADLEAILRGPFAGPEHRLAFLYWAGIGGLEDFSQAFRPPRFIV